MVAALVWALAIVVGDGGSNGPGSGSEIRVPERSGLKSGIQRTEVRAPTEATIVVHCDRPTVDVSPRLYGIFFEEINHAGDGGLYAEMVRNRSFAEGEGAAFWRADRGGKIETSTSSERHAGETFLSLVGPVGAGLVNDGYWGMSLQRGTRYRLRYKGFSSGSTIVFNLENQAGEVLATHKVEFGDAIKSEEVTLVPLRSTGTGRLVVRIAKGPHFVLDLVSLTPESGWKGRAHGLRNDLARMLDGLKPAFVRFPGGCWVEGDTMATAMRWKETIGSIWERRSLPNLWGYTSTNGLGFHEYLQMCEDLGAEPLFVINCGMSHKENVPLEKMGEFVQDALDAIEYANGPVTSTWGAKRAAAGHPKPFHLRLMEIGNENGGKAYAERYPLFVKAIKAKHPEVQLIANVWGGYPKDAPVDIIDEHYYNNPAFFFENADRYDSYDRKGPKVYVGEYAVTQGCGQGNLIAAVAEAAFMTGMERNSDHVVMSSYAPLFANVNAKAWNPDLINFDSGRAYGTPSFYVQKLFASNRPDHVLKADVPEVVSEAKAFPPGGFGVGTWATQAEFKDIKVVQDGSDVFESRDGEGLTDESGTWAVRDGLLKQTSGVDGARRFAGHADAKTTAVTLKARKTGGAEGFLITVGRQGDKDYLWWNIGGWGNTQHAIEHSVGGAKALVGRPVSGSVETGRWYDIKVEYGPERIRCWLDGRLVHDEKPVQTKVLFATAGRKDSDGTVIVKAVNGGSKALDTDVVFEGVGAVVSCEGEVLTSRRPIDENTLERPNLVSPKKVKATVAGGRLSVTLPACSVTVLRCRVKAR
ncbi:MAG: alpha-L-arabinofuranosidase [Armatimonadetes bacterium]|nr:alpha-L-arabinofuranosidase [Armatimonadota bacterium]